MEANFAGYIYNMLEGCQQKHALLSFGLSKDVAVNAIIVKPTLKVESKYRFQWRLLSIKAIRYQIFIKI